MSKRPCILPGLLILCVSLTTACQSPRPGTATGSRLAELDARATIVFTDSMLLKPSEVGTTDLSWSLAPLFLKETTTATLNSVPPGQPPALDPWPALRTPLPVVYAMTDAVEIQGRIYARFTYLWQSPGFEPANQVSPTARLQAVRIILGSNGQPVLWEVLADSSGLALLFVSRSLEDAARREYGPPLSGCRYAIEASPASARDATVARILEDGPVAMGPILYLAADGRDITTLICRCMPAQAKTVRAARTYDLIRLPAPQLPPPLDKLRPTAGPRPAFWPGLAESPARLEGALRLPTRF